MTVETVWWISAIIVAAVLWFWVQIHLLVGLIVGAFIGLGITTIMKIFNWRFAKSSEYSSSSRSSSSYDSWDD